MGGDDVVLADFDVVGDLDEVVDFGALADEGRFEAGAVDGGVGADFNVVFEDDMPSCSSLMWRPCLSGV